MKCTAGIRLQVHYTGNAKINAIKAFRAFLGSTLRTAKSAIEGEPVSVSIGYCSTIHSEEEAIQNFCTMLQKIDPNIFIRVRTSEVLHLDLEDDA